MVTALGPNSSPLTKAGGEEVRANVEQSAQNMLPQAVEKTFKIEELKGKEIMGYYFTLTDKAPKPGEWKYMTQGMAKLQSLLIFFTILDNRPDAPERTVALDMLRQARVHKP